MRRFGLDLKDEIAGVAVLGNQGNLEARLLAMTWAGLSHCSEDFHREA